MSDRKAIPLRLSQEVYEVIQTLAAQDLRSINAEIEFLLREAILRRTQKQIEPKD